MHLVAVALTVVALLGAPPPRRAAPSFPPEGRMSRASQPAMDEPPLRGTARFQDLGTTVQRVADGRHHYAKTSPWNADESYAMLLDGRILDGSSYRPVKTIRLPDEHRTWSNVDPDVILGVSRHRWVRVEISTGRMTVLATYPEYRAVSYGAYEGNTDDADRSAVLIGDGSVPFVVDAHTGRIRCTIPSRGKVSDATMSHDGRHALVNWAKGGVDAYDVSCRLERHLSDANSHYDACVSSRGEQVIVQAPDASLVMTSIETGERTTVYADSAMRVHVSCRNTHRPGWAYVSPYGDTADAITTGQRMWQRGFAVKLDGSKTVQVFAWLHMAFPTHYDDDPMLVPSRLGDRVWWKVRWDGRSGLHSFVAGR